MTPILFDSNILVYAHNLDSPFHQQAKELHKRVVFGELIVAISIQNLLEFYSTITNPRLTNKPQDPVTAYKSCLAYSEAGFKIIYPKENRLQYGFSLAKNKKITGRRIFDVYLVATMLSNGINTIYTLNEKDFKIFSEIKVVNPFS